MTKLYYRVGNETFDSYNSAVARSKSLGLPLTACYEPVIEETKIDKGLRERRAAAIRAKAKARAI